MLKMNCLISAQEFMNMYNIHRESQMQLIILFLSLLHIIEHVYNSDTATYLTINYDYKNVTEKKHPRRQAI